MRSLSLEAGASAPLSVVCIGAHADDIEIGCGGTVRQLVQQHPGSTVRWWVLTGDDRRHQETAAAARCLVGDFCELRVTASCFRDGYLAANLGDVKDAFEAFRASAEPDVIFTHTRADRHQDHRQVSDLTWNTWRDHLILEYEIPKWDGDLGQPNFYVPLTEDTMSCKVETLLTCFPTQRAKAWFDEGTFRGLARLRGLECRAPDAYAEAFHARKIGGRL
jgi:LmbE family N-acetylglucosaminyl deacetylase